MPRFDDIPVDRAELESVRRQIAQELGQPVSLADARLYLALSGYLAEAAKPPSADVQVVDSTRQPGRRSSVA